MGPIVSSLLVFSVLKSSNSGWWSTQHQFLKDPGSFSPGFPYGFLQLPSDLPLLGRLELGDKDMLRNQPGLLDLGIRAVVSLPLNLQAFGSGTICRKLRGTMHWQLTIPNRKSSPNHQFSSGKLVVFGVVFLKMWYHSGSIYNTEIGVCEQEPSLGKGRTFALQYAIIHLNGVFYSDKYLRI